MLVVKSEVIERSDGGGLIECEIWIWRGEERRVRGSCGLL
jgi:hypothetical protein